MNIATTSIARTVKRVFVFSLPKAVQRRIKALKNVQVM
jgi:phage terminase Nu1 subunit (DNA packaging protein)